MVEALKIEHIVFGELGGGATIHPVDTRYPPFNVTSEYVAKHGPRAGGYWVRYEDLYPSFSPAKAFDEGYTLVPTKPTIAEIEELLKAEPDAKVTINPDGTVTWDGPSGAVCGLLGDGSPFLIQGPAAQNLYPQQEDAATTVSDPDTHA